MINFGRSYAVIVGAAGSGLAFSSARPPALQIKFTIEKTALSSPNKAKITIYNLSPDTEARIGKQFDQIVLLAGYDEDNALLFSGNIQSVIKAEDDGVNTYVEVTAGDGDFDYQRATINATVAAGSHSEVIAAAIATFTSTTPGPVNVSSINQRSRGKVLSGATRDVLTTLSRELDAHWSIQDGQLVVCGIKDAIPTPTIPLISRYTGMIKKPKVTEKGIQIEELLAPTRKIGGLVQLDAIETSTGRQNPNGLHKIVKIKHEGDFFGDGDAWKTTLECVAYNG